MCEKLCKWHKFLNIFQKNAFFVCYIFKKNYCSKIINSNQATIKNFIVHVVCLYVANFTHIVIAPFILITCNNSCEQIINHIQTHTHIMWKMPSWHYLNNHFYSWMPEITLDFTIDVFNVFSVVFVCIYNAFCNDVNLRLNVLCIYIK